MKKLSTMWIALSLIFLRDRFLRTALGWKVNPGKVTVDGMKNGLEWIFS